MKKTDRLLALILAMLMMLSFSTIAFADEGDIGSDALEAAVTPEPAAADAATTTQPINDNNTGIIDKTQLDNWMENFMARHEITGDQQTVSVGFYYSGTGDSWYYDADVWMYSASLYKVPVSMLVAEKEAAGEITQDTSITGGTIGYLESTALTYSNNTSGHALVDYMGGTYAGKCADVAKKYTSLPDSYFTDSNFQENSYYTARFMTQVMTTLLNNSDSYPHVVEYLLEAQPGDYFKKTITGYDIAQKYGAYEEKNSTNNNHCAAIIYTPHPIVVVVMTKNVSDFEDCIGEIGKMLTDYALTLDENLASYQQSQAASASASQETAAQTAQAAASSETAQSDTAAQETAVPVETTPASARTTETTKSKNINTIMVLAIVLLAIVLLAMVVLLIVNKVRANRYDEYDDEDYYDDEEDEDEEDDDEENEEDWEEARGRAGRKTAKASSMKKLFSRRKQDDDEYDDEYEDEDEEEDEPVEAPQVKAYRAKPEPYPAETQPVARSTRSAAPVRPIARPKVAEPEEEYETDEDEMAEAPVHRGFVSFTGAKKATRAAASVREEENAEPAVENEPAAAPRGRHSAPAGSHASSSTSHIDRSNYKPRH